MKRLCHSISHFALIILAPLVVPPVSMCAQEFRLKAKTSIGDGWHPWYEIKADPENSQNLIVCGTKWDAAANAPFGFVYASSDEGATWHSVLEDKNSAWVTEHSCSYGPSHRAYFISGASRVIDGVPHHELGTTRLFISTDSGWNWVETIKTGWADYSTSAVSSESGKLYTFFNFEAPAQERGKIHGGSIDLLVFSPDGKEVAGPFSNSAMRRLGYYGVFPSSAIALKSGSVVAAYYGKRQSPTGWQADLGVVRADRTRKASLEPTVISHPVMDWDKGCFNYSDNSLAYSPEEDRLFLAYVDGCREASQILLTSSADEGKTWTKAVVVIDRRNPDGGLYSPTLAVTAGGVLMLLWEEGKNRRSGNWRFSYIQNSGIVTPPIELSHSSKKYEISDDSLRVAIDQSRTVDSSGSLESSLITLTVLSELNIVWRGNGLIATGNNVLAVWPSGNSDGTRLNSAVLVPRESGSHEETVTRPKGSNDANVTRQTMILYNAGQHFDSNTGTLEVCMSLANHGNQPIRLPVKLEARDISSPAGSVSILNASNGLTGPGAVWNIGHPFTEGQILPGTSSRPFCMTFHLESSTKGVSSREADELLILKMGVQQSSEKICRE